MTQAFVSFHKDTGEICQLIHAHGLLWLKTSRILISPLKHRGYTLSMCLVQKNNNNDRVQHYFLIYTFVLLNTAQSV